MLSTLDHLASLLRPGRTDERGQGLVEYALVLVLVAVVVIVVLVLLGPQISEIFCDVAGELGDTCEEPCVGECGPT